MQEAKSGKLHPLTQITRKLCAVFVDMGFEISISDHLETEENNFDNLNVPKDHPARDMQDTFWIKGMPGYVMRTHNSAHQVPYMRENIQRLESGETLKMVSPGLVYRNEATDATHEVQFSYLEGLVVGKDISLAHLKGTLEHFLKQVFGEDVEMRLRPGYFPFVEPGVEVDLKFKGKWLELLGAGIVHPEVLKNAGVDPKQYSGFAFGVGIDRLAMMKWEIPDVRLFYQGDLRLHNALDEF